MKIHFAIQCYNFQHRLSWQLSSLLQQIGELPDLTIDVAYLPNNGKPYTTEALLKIFQMEGLNIVHSKYFSSQPFGYRGITRNRQIKNAVNGETDWIFFADCDNVYPPTFFAELKNRLENCSAATTNCITSIAKTHTKPKATNFAVRINEGDSPVVPFVHQRALQIPTIEKHNKPIAAGCMQVACLSAIELKNGGLYVDPEKCKDSHLLRQGQRAKSDVQFRRSMGGTTRIKLPTQIHLNHRRDKEEGQHLKEQR